MRLRRFRNGGTMTGDAVGAVGARYLAKDLTLGVCPRLSVMDLSWNNIGRLGADALAQAFAKKATPHLVTLRLKANDLPPPSTKGLADALVAGGLPALQELDLRANLLGDEGARALAHAALAGGLRAPFRRLLLQSNEIRSVGVRALFQACTQRGDGDAFRGGAPSHAPELELVSVRFNKADAEMVAGLKPCPTYFQM